jgi:hypothetical protein
MEIRKILNASLALNSKWSNYPKMRPKKIEKPLKLINFK